MPLDPVTGPLPKERLKELADAPFGVATKVIREYDPLWARTDGEKFEWKIRVRRSGRGRGTAFIQASNQQEADKIADDLMEEEIDWDYGDDFEIISVEPHKA